MGDDVKWMLLSPREVGLFDGPFGEVGNAPLVRLIARKINRATGDLELSAAELRSVRVAARNYQAGYERQLKAILSAAERH